MGELPNPNHESQITNPEFQTPRERSGRAKPFRRKALESMMLEAGLPRMRQGEDNTCGIGSATGGSPLRFEIADWGLGDGRCQIYWSGV